MDDVIAFTKSGIGSRIYAWRKETIERSFAEAKVNHGLRYARMLGIQNMREQCFLTATIQNIKRLVASLLFHGGTMKLDGSWMISLSRCTTLRKRMTSRKKT